MTKETIINCFRKCGNSKDSQDQALADSDDPFADLSDALEKFSLLSPGVVKSRCFFVKSIFRALDLLTLIKIQLLLVMIF